MPGPNSIFPGSAFCCCSVAQSYWTLCDPKDCSTPGFLSFTIFWGVLKLRSTEPSNHLILCLPLLFMLSTFPSIRVFSNELAVHIKWPKYWSFSFSISPPSGYSLNFLGGSNGKESACNAGDLNLISGLGRPLGEGNGYPLQYSCLENSMDRGAWLGYSS